MKDQILWCAAVWPPHSLCISTGLQKLRIFHLSVLVLSMLSSSLSVSLSMFLWPAPSSWTISYGAEGGIVNVNDFMIALSNTQHFSDFSGEWGLAGAERDGAQLHSPPYALCIHWSQHKEGEKCAQLTMNTLHSCKFLLHWKGCASC